MLLRLRSLSVYERWMLVVVVLATALRLILIYCKWPFTESDEGNMGILAFNVAFQGDHPIFFYGAPYMGPVEGYLAAPLFRLFGSSLFALRLPLVLFFAIFLLGIYYLLCLLYKSQLFALAMTILLGLGSPDVLFLQLRASGEYPEIEMLAVLMCLLAVWLALTSPAPGTRPGWRVQARRLALYGLLGLIIGCAAWIDLLILPFVAASGLLLCIFCWRDLLRWPGLVLLIGCVVGGFPLIYYNLTAPWDQNSWNVLMEIHKSGAAQMLASHLTWINQVSGTFLVSLPMATGGGISCPISAIPPLGHPTAQTWPCVIFQGAWSAGYLVAGLGAAWLAGWLIWKLVRQGGGNLTNEAQFEKRQEMIRQAGRLVLLVSAALTLLLYLDAPAPATSPDTAFRYLTCLLIALPVLLWPLWQGLKTERFRVRWWVRTVLLLCVAAVLLSGLIRTFAQISTSLAVYQQNEDLVQNLLEHGSTRIYSDYWTCNTLTFLSQEKIICSALNDSLGPGYDRYTPYKAIVDNASRQTYIFPQAAPQVKVMQQRIQKSSQHYHIYTFAQYIIYQPV